MRLNCDPAPWLLLALLAFLPASAASGADPERQLQALDFLAGNWIAEMEDGEMVAHYSTSQGGMVLSYTELRRAGKVAFYEFERFSIEDGVVVFSPYPGGKPAVQMPLTTLDATAKRAVFEHPTKDFPTRISYQVSGENQLVISLDDPHGGSDQVQRFEFRRQP